MQQNNAMQGWFLFNSKFQLQDTIDTFQNDGLFFIALYYEAYYLILKEDESDKILPKVYHLVREYMNMVINNQGEDKLILILDSNTYILEGKGIHLILIKDSIPRNNYQVLQNKDNIEDIIDITN